MFGKSASFKYWKERTDRTLDHNKHTPDAEDILQGKDLTADSIDREALSWVRRRLEAKDRPDVLDVGCGYGRWARALAGTYHSYTGVDPVGRRIQRAQQVYVSGVTQFQTVPETGKWSLGRKFDVILFAAVLQHLPSRVCRALLTTAGEHLAPGGVILLVEWGMDGLPEGPPIWNQAPAAQYKTKPFSSLRASLPGFAWAGTNGRVEVSK